VRRSLLIALLLAALPGSAHAAVWKGSVTFVDDGDTIEVDVAGDRTPRPARIRVTGIQAMELSRYGSRRRAGDCHAVAAARRLERLVRSAHGRVRLTAEHPASSSRGRLLRSVAVKLPGGWRDVGAAQLRAGVALWWPTRAEPARNRGYSAISQKAIAAGRGLFDPDGCGAGPSAASPLSLRVNWDGDGDDNANLDGEWVRIRNLDPVNAVPIGGWHVRDSGLRRFRFPPQATIAPAGTLRLRVGAGGNGPDLGWGLRRPVFENSGGDGMGDGAYLFDTLGNVRASMVYPCRGSCSDPAQGAVAVTADPEGRDESITLKNLTSAPLGLDGYVLKSPPSSYPLEDGAVLPPGGSLRLQVVGDPAGDTALERHWGYGKPILRDGGDVARLATYTDITIACTAWGDKSC